MARYGVVTPVDWNRVEKLAKEYKDSVYSPRLNTKTSAREERRYEVPTHPTQPLPDHLVKKFADQQREEEEERRKAMQIKPVQRGGMFPDEYVARKEAKEKSRQRADPAPPPPKPTPPVCRAGHHEKGAAFKMFDLEEAGKVWAFELGTVMEAAGYRGASEFSDVLLQTFGIAQGAPVTLTEFHALCDYYESMMKKQRPATTSAQRGLAYKGFPGYEPGGKPNSPLPDPLPGSDEEVEEEEGRPFDPRSLPPRPTHLPCNKELPQQQAAFMMFDLSASGCISIIDLPSALVAAGFKKVKFSPHVQTLLQELGITETEITFLEYQKMCIKLKEQRR